MKKTITVLASAFFLFTLSNCAKSPLSKDAKKEQNAPQKPISIPASVANAITDFSFFFFKNLQTDQPAADNIFVSPLSLHMALGMLVNGATDATKQEIMQALKAENISQADLNASYKKLLEELPKADPKVNLGLANSIWYKNSFPVEADFLNTMKTSFEAQVTGLPFIPSDVNIINKWASDKTNGKIDKVLQEIKEGSIMFLINALYFKGDWTSQFDKKNTRDQPFTLENGTTKTVKMMNQTETFEYASLGDYEAVQLPYGNQQFRATIILPKKGRSLETVFAGFDMTQWDALQSSFKSQKIILGLPKFTLKQEFQLKNTLQKMGMKRAFDVSTAELKGIHKTAPLFVSFVKQNTFVGVDEVGTEAAAVTTIGVTYTSMPVYPEMICNRPFAFIISEKTSNTILFMGRIMSPDIN